MFSFRKKTFGSSNKKIIFLLNGYQGKIWNYYLTARILELYGYCSIAYEYDDSILSSSVTETLENTYLVKNDIVREIQKYRKKNYESFSIFGTSYGTIIGFMVANEEDAVSKLIINLSTADIAGVVWSFVQNNDRMVNEFIARQNIAFEDLKSFWTPISPENNIDKLGNRQILFYEALKDDIIPYALQSRLLAKLRKITNRIRVMSNNRFSHVVSGALNLIRYPLYVDFLENALPPTSSGP